MQRHTYTTTSNKTMHLNVYQFILYRNLVALIPTQNLFNMCPHISKVENTALSKADMGVFQYSLSLFYLIYTGGTRL